jgi:hypothetical protein
MQKSVINVGNNSKSSILLISMASSYLEVVSGGIPPVAIFAIFARLPKPNILLFGFNFGSLSSIIVPVLMIGGMRA